MLKPLFLQSLMEKKVKWKKVSWIYRLTNNSTFFFSILQSGFGGRTSTFLWLSWAFSSPSSPGCLSIPCGFPSPTGEVSVRGLGGTGREECGFGLLKLDFGAESSCSGGTEGDPSWSPSFWLCSWRAFSRWSCCRLFFTGRRRCGSNGSVWRKRMEKNSLVWAANN